MTRFDLAVYPGGKLWGGSRNYSLDDKAALLDAVVKFGNDWDSDFRAALLFNLAYLRSNDTFIVLANLEYTEPTEDPAIFDSFATIPSSSDTMGIKNLSDIALEIKDQNVNGKRECYWNRHC